LTLGEESGVGPGNWTHDDDGPLGEHRVHRATDFEIWSVENGSEKFHVAIS